MKTSARAIIGPHQISTKLKNKIQPEKSSENLFHLESYDYQLPSDRIAQKPVTPRDASKLMALNRISGAISQKNFIDLPQLLRKGDIVVLNNTRVIPARLQSDRGEVLLVQETENNCWDCLVHPGKKFRPGDIVSFENGSTADVLSLSTIGRILRFHVDVQSLLNTCGNLPLPPYIHRTADESDEKRYQTIYARIPGSIAAPTAGLHFTHRVVKSLRNRGVEIVRITLHVGPGTFKPVQSEDIRKHTIHPEYYRCSQRVWGKIRNARRVVTVGTTTTRALETIAATDELQGSTSLFIYPGYRFRITGALLTNFHLPKSSLLMLVSAFGGYQHVQRAYAFAVKEAYRFYSYGDAMLIL